MMVEDGPVKSIKATLHVVGHETTEDGCFILFSERPGGETRIRFLARSASSFELAPVGSTYMLISTDVLKLAGMWSAVIP